MSCYYPIPRVGVRSLAPTIFESLCVIFCKARLSTKPLRICFRGQSDSGFPLNLGWQFKRSVRYMPCFMLA